jgi:outer membrane lipoprotein SlyB
VIVNTRQVRVDSADLLEENGLGLISGGVLGGLVGSTIGQGTGRVVAAGVGVLLGSVGGTFFEKKLKAQMASEYIIRLDSGQLATLVQAPHPVLAVGQRVLVMTAQKGRSRVVADTTIPSTLRS